MMTFCGKKTQWESFTWHESLFESRVLHFDIFDGAPLVTRGDMEAFHRRFLDHQEQEHATAFKRRQE